MRKRLECVKLVLHNLVDSLRKRRSSTSVLEEGLAQSPHESLIARFQSRDQSKASDATKELERALIFPPSVTEADATKFIRVQAIELLVTVATTCPEHEPRYRAVGLLSQSQNYPALERICAETPYLDTKKAVVDNIHSVIALNVAKRLVMTAAVVQSDYQSTDIIRSILTEPQRVIFGVGHVTGSNDRIYEAMDALARLAILFASGTEANALARRALSELTKSPDEEIAGIAQGHLKMARERDAPLDLSKLGR